MKLIYKTKIITLSLLIPCLVPSFSFADSALNIIKAARKPEAKLKIKSSKVPTYSLTDSKGGKVKSIPRLDIGEEAQLSANEMSPLRLPASQEIQLKKVKRNPSPELNKSQNFVVPLATQAKIITPSNSIDKIPNIKDLLNIPNPLVSEPNLQTKALQEMSENDHKMLQALIFLEMKKNYELAMGLFAELMQSQSHKIPALFHYGKTAKGLGLNSEFRESMLKVAKESKEKIWKIKATQELVDNVSILSSGDIESIDPLVAANEIDVSGNELYLINRAKYYLNHAQLGSVEEALLLIPEKSEVYNEALLVSGLYNYRRGKIDEAIIDLEKSLKISNKDWNQRSIAAITLARMFFQKSQFKEAFQAYLQVEKSDSLWLQAMVEQAWTQILSEDFEGAAGNMFSLHTEFFKNAFSPESYVVRTVGYLNLCQFGDGMQVLTEMKKKYGHWKEKMDVYKSNHKEVSSFYETIKSWVKNSDLKEVDGLPRSFIVELARHPGFIKAQTRINDFEDEISKFNKITLTLIRMEKENLQKQNEIIKISKTASEREQALEPLKIELQIAKRASTSIKNLRTQSISRIEKEKTELRKEASQAVAVRFKELNASLDKVLGQNEVLQYELYSGAGEHIRYQMAGGEVNDKSRDQLKVQDGKSMHWKTKGEVWEDEVGHYRSSLKNVCPKEAVADSSH